MEYMGLNDIRKSFLDFFYSKDHLVESSYSLVPQNDKSLLLINAGMAPLKNYFMGIETPPKNRMATCQKCIRTGDIENVGQTARHATFFEMLGNFSFGDYFKKESLSWGWEYITEILKLPVDKLWATVYFEDDEAFDIWKNDIGIPEERIVRLGKEDNFWEIGTGPCGPCSEIYYDRGERFGCGSPDCKPGCECDRYIEFWNHVFTQFDKDEEGVYHKLANPNIDTGMGLERIACIIQGVDSIFEIDTIAHILNEVTKVANYKYGTDKTKDISIRIITDHIRAVSFLVSDGVMPNNEGRGYVLRRLLRRAARHGKLLGIEGNFLHDLVDEVIKVSGDAYPELKNKEDYVKKVIKIEEERFQATIDTGLNILNGYIGELKNESLKMLSGEKAFKLYDTYGFPLDLTKEILEENSMTVDEKNFKKEMENQRERARMAIANKDDLGWKEDPLISVASNLKSEFVGYEMFDADGEIIAIGKENGLADVIEEGEKGYLVLSKTPFYGESGGQVGDKGIIKGENFEFKVTDTKKGVNGLHIHHGYMKSGLAEKGDHIHGMIDVQLRCDTAKNHTSTHLLHRALRNALGDHIEQAGSFVDEHRLRFDFNHYTAMTDDEIKRVEKEVNDVIMKALKVNVSIKTLDEAKEMGATALFGEKYGNEVRVVEVDDYSLELCGGTHISNSIEAGIFKILSETGVAAGVRRIEAITGREVYKLLNDNISLIDDLSQILKTNKKDVTSKAELIVDENKSLYKEIESLKNKEIDKMSKEILAGQTKVNEFNVITKRIDGLELDDVRNLGDKLIDKLENGILIFAITGEGKLTFLAMASKSAVEKGVHAGKLIKEIGKVAGGGGGGKPHMAQAGGKDLSKIDEAINHGIEIIKNI